MWKFLLDFPSPATLLQKHTFCQCDKGHYYILGTIIFTDENKWQIVDKIFFLVKFPRIIIMRVIYNYCILHCELLARCVTAEKEPAAPRQGTTTTIRASN